VEIGLFKGSYGMEQRLYVHAHKDGEKKRKCKSALAAQEKENGKEHSMRNFSGFGGEREKKRELSEVNFARSN